MSALAKPSSFENLLMQAWARIPSLRVALAQSLSAALDNETRISKLNLQVSWINKHSLRVHALGVFKHASGISLQCRVVGYVFFTVGQQEEAASILVCSSLFGLSWLATKNGLLHFERRIAPQLVTATRLRLPKTRTAFNLLQRWWGEGKTSHSARIYLLVVLINWGGEELQRRKNRFVLILPHFARSSAEEEIMRRLVVGFGEENKKKLLGLSMMREMKEFWVLMRRWWLLSRVYCMQMWFMIPRDEDF